MKQTRCGTLVMMLVSLSMVIALIPGIHRVSAAGEEKVIAKAQKAESKGDLDEAEKVLKEFLQTQPDNGPANLSLAGVLRQKDMGTEALEAVTKAAKAMPQDKDVSIEKIKIFIAQTYLQDAATELQILQKLAPEEPLNNLFMAQIYKDSDEPAKALESITAYLQKKPDDKPSVELAAEIAASAGEFDRALQYYTQLKEKFPNDIKYLVKLGEVASAANKTAEARNYLNEVVKRSKEKKKEPAGEKPLVAQAHYLLGMLAAKENKAEEAETEIYEATQLYPLLSKAYTDYAEYLLKQQQIGKAKDILDAAMQANRHDGRVMLMLARVYAANNDFDSAYKYLKEGLTLVTDVGSENDYQQALDLLGKAKDTDNIAKVIDDGMKRYPKSVLFHRLKGKQYQQGKDLDKALEEYTTALSINPKDTETYYLLGLLYEEKKSYEQAALYYEQAVNIDGSMLDAMTHLAGMKLRLKDFNRAYELYNKVVQQKADDPEVLFRFAICNDELGKFDKSQEIYAQVLTLKPNFLPAMNNLGIVYLKLKKLNEAEDIFKKAVEVNPSFKDAHRNLAYIYQQRGDNEKSKAELALSQ